MKKWLIRISLAIVIFAIGLIVFIAVAYLLLNKTNGSLRSAGEKRTYLLYVPASYNPDDPTPLVITLHGFAEWPAHQMQISHWNDQADRDGFIVVYPSGTQFPLRWRTNGDPGSPTDPAAEIQFITDLIDHLSGQYNIDPNRIYANGFSNGGGMSFVLACRLADRIAAFGSVSGAYMAPWETCSPSRPVPAILFHGTADPIVPFEGGPSQTIHNPLPDIPTWVDTLALRSGCSPIPQPLPASGDVSGIQYQNCAADVIFYTIAGGGHGWPGGDPIPEFIVGFTSQDIDATQVIWDFFQQHPLNK